VRKKPGFTIMVSIPKGSTSSWSDCIHASRPNFDAAYAVSNAKPASPALDEIEIICPECCLRITGRTARVTFIGPMRRLSITAAHLFRCQLFKEARRKSCGVVDQDIDAAKRFNRHLDGGFGIGRACNVQSWNEQVGGLPKGQTHLAGIAASGNDSIACGQGSLRNVDSHSTSGTSAKPNGRRHRSRPHPSGRHALARCRVLNRGKLGGIFAGLEIPRGEQDGIPWHGELVSDGEANAAIGPRYECCSFHVQLSN
jgi:hypothetical protein